jgi:hypothetical protein
VTEHEQRDHRDAIIKVRAVLETVRHGLTLAIQKAPGITIDGEPNADLAAIHRELRKALECVYVANLKTYSLYPAR